MKGFYSIIDDACAAVFCVWKKRCLAQGATQPDLAAVYGASAGRKGNVFAPEFLERLRLEYGGSEHLKEALSVVVMLKVLEQTRPSGMSRGPALNRAAETLRVEHAVIRKNEAFDPAHVGPVG